SDPRLPSLPRTLQRPAVSPPDLAGEGDLNGRRREGQATAGHRLRRAPKYEQNVRGVRLRLAPRGRAIRGPLVPPPPPPRRTQPVARRDRARNVPQRPQQAQASHPVRQMPLRPRPERRAQASLAAGWTTRWHGREPTKARSVWSASGGD